jgi:glycosyltransferase involved in cell wall biosynthesis
MSSRPAIALVVPAYNAARHLPTLFESVAALLEPFDEVIVCDDASQDDTIAVAERLGARVIRRARNGGCSAAKNTGLEHVRSPWVHFHDADDLLAPHFTRLARAALQADDCDVLLPAWDYRDGVNGEVISRSALDPVAVANDPIAVNLIDTIPNVGVYRVSLLRAHGGFDCDADKLYNEDRAFHLKLAEAGARFRAVTENGLSHVRHGDSMSQRNQVRCLLANAAVTLAYVDRHGARHAQACGAALWRAATGLATYGQWRDALALIDAATRLGARVEPRASPRFAALCRINPKLALWTREIGVRLFKPRLRDKVST